MDDSTFIEDFNQSNMHTVSGHCYLCFVHMVGLHFNLQITSQDL